LPDISSGGCVVKEVAKDVGILPEFSGLYTYLEEGSSIGKMNQRDGGIARPSKRMTNRKGE
jgi:hypothetical protein